MPTEISIMQLSKIMRELPDPQEYARSNNYPYVVIAFVDNAWLEKDNDVIMVQPKTIQFGLKAIRQATKAERIVGPIKNDTIYEWVSVTELRVKTETY